MRKGGKREADTVSIEEKDRERKRERELERERETDRGNRENIVKESGPGGERERTGEKK